VRGYIGHASRPDALPLEMYGAAPLQRQPEGPALLPLVGTDPLLPEFCSLPVPRIISRSAGKGGS